VEVLRIPYKVIKQSRDKLATISHKNGIMCIDKPQTTEMQINRFYPRYVDDIQPFNEWLSVNHPEQMALYDKYKFTFWHGFECEQLLSRYATTEELATCKELQEEYQTAQQSFKNEQQRRYLFARFYVSFDFNSFSGFDFYGDTSHTQAEIEQFRRECLEIQSDYINRPQVYFNEFVPLEKTTSDDMSADTS
jgi:hypothetical protein